MSMLATKMNILRNCSPKTREKHPSDIPLLGCMVQLRKGMFGLLPMKVIRCELTAVFY